MKTYFEETYEIPQNKWHFVAQQINKNSKKRVDLTVDYIKNKVYSYFNLTADEAEKDKRDHNLVKARKIAMYFSRKYTKESLKSIGGKIAGKDHSTVMYSIATVENCRIYYKEFDKQICEIEKFFIHLR